MRFVQFTLAGKPMAKGRVRFTRTGHAFTPEKTVAYEGQLAFAAQTAMDGGIPTDKALLVDLSVYMPVAASWPAKKRQMATNGDIRPTGRPDLDNFAKMLDALNHIVWMDDSQIVTLIVQKWYSTNPRMMVTVDIL
jgi:Holliday junction resolvase RusA-like endonuclease